MYVEKDFDANWGKFTATPLPSLKHTHTTDLLDLPSYHENKENAILQVI